MAKIQLCDCDFLISQNLNMDFHETPETARIKYEIGKYTILFKNV